MSMNFTRRISNRYSRLGKRRKNKLKWKRPTGRDNKMRDKRKGYPKTVSIGYRKSKELRRKNLEKIKLVMNLKDLENLDKNNEIIIGKIGRKKKTEIVKKANEKGLKIVNINVKKFMKNMEKENEPKK